MGTRTDELLTKPKMTTARWIAILVIIGALLGLGYCAARVLLQLGDEPPIRVRNGSMKLELDRGEWKDNGDGWSPSAGKNSGGFTVKVESSPGYSCGPGQPVRGSEVLFSYSDSTEVKVSSPGSSGRTKVQPKDTLRKASLTLLEYGQAGDQGYITAVEVKDGGTRWRCEFKDGNALRVISVCPMPNPDCDR
jgi:hypothetical protein